MKHPHRVRTWHRKKGATLPADVVYCGRPSRYGNPYIVGTSGTREECLQKFRDQAEANLARDPAWLEPLRGRRAACWCRDDEACHVDILLELRDRTYGVEPLENEPSPATTVPPAPTSTKSTARELFT